MYCLGKLGNRLVSKPFINIHGAQTIVSLRIIILQENGPLQLPDCPVKVTMLVIKYPKIVMRIMIIRLLFRNLCPEGVFVPPVIVP